MKAPPVKVLSLAMLCYLLMACVPIKETHFSEQSQQQLDGLAQWRQSQKAAIDATKLTDLINSPAALRLVEHGLKHNPGLQQSALAIEIARQAVVSAQGDRLPESSLTLGQNKTEGESSRYQTNLPVSWTLDWLGKLKNGVDVKEAALLNTIAADQYARDLLASSIMNAWLQWVQQQQLIDIERQRLKVLEQNETTIVERYRKGLDALSDLDSARSQSASSRATLASYIEAHQALGRALAVLTGDQDVVLQAANQFPEVFVPLASLPAQDLGRRPDLQQAYLNIRMADLNSAIAYKALLPSFSLTATFSGSDTSFQDALLTSPAWSLLGQLTAPLFQGGKLRAAAKQAELRAEQAYWAYQETLLAAVKETEDALGQEKALTEQQFHIEDALANAERSFAIYQTKYRQGLVSFLDLLMVQTQTFDLQMQRSQIIYQRLSNRIILGLALGLGVEQ